MMRILRKRETNKRDKRKYQVYGFEGGVNGTMYAGHPTRVNDAEYRWLMRERIRFSLCLGIVTRKDGELNVYREDFRPEKPITGDTFTGFFQEQIMRHKKELVEEGEIEESDILTTFYLASTNEKEFLDDVFIWQTIFRLKIPEKYITLKEKQANDKIDEDKTKASEEYIAGCLTQTREAIASLRSNAEKRVKF